LFGADGGANKPSADLPNLEDIKPNLTDNEDDLIDVDLTFKKRIKIS